MSHHDFFSDAAKARAADAVRNIEAQTAAEIVVTVRRVSDRYRDADVIVGSAFAFLVLLLLLFLPQSFDVRFMPLDVLLAFFVGFGVSTRSHALRRLATRRRTREALVETAARAAFVELGVSNTQGRTGILVYVSTLEAHVVLVSDLAVERAGVDAALAAAREAMTTAVAKRDFAAFTAHLEALGPDLAKCLPRAADDVNELPDEVRA